MEVTVMHPLKDEDVSSIPGIRRQVEEALAALDSADQAMLEALSRFEQSPDPGGPDEVAFLEAMATRKRASLMVGLALLRWQDHGGRVILQHPEDVPVDNVLSLDNGVDAALRALADEHVPEPITEETPPDPEPVQEAPTPEPVQEVPVLPPEPVVEAPAPTSPPEPKATFPPPSAASLGRLVEWSRGGLPTQVDRLQAILDRLGEPTKVDSLQRYHAEVNLIAQETAMANLTEWLTLDRQDQQALIGLVVSRARHLQDEAGPALQHPFVGSALDSVFSRLTAFSGEHRPGFVIGLMRSHSPDSGTWLGDAKEWWRMLCPQFPNGTIKQSEAPNPDRTLHHLAGVVGADEVDPVELAASISKCLLAKVSVNDPRFVKLLLPHINLLTKEPKFKSLRKAIREYQKELVAEGRAADTDSTLLPADWPYWKWTRGKVAVIVGGDKRTKTADRFREVFDFAEVQWESGWQIRKLESLAERVQSGAIDMVIMLARFMSHDAWYLLVPPCKSKGSPFILVESGYGVSQVRNVMEQTLAGWLDGNED